MKLGGEQELLSRCRRGDSAAWDELFDTHYSAVGRFVCQLASDLTREDVEEICQEVFLSVIRHLESFQGGSQLQTWLYRIAANKAKDYRERQQAQKRGGGQMPLSIEAADPETGLTLNPPSALPLPDEQLLARERIDLVSQALEQIDSSCRELISLRYFAELSYEEIGRALDLHTKTVSSRLSRCLDRLEACLRNLFSGEKSELFTV